MASEERIVDFDAREMWLDPAVYPRRAGFIKHRKLAIWRKRFASSGKRPLDNTWLASSAWRSTKS